MNPSDHELSYTFGDTLPDHGGALEVAPGILWLRMGLPFALNHINLWLLRDTMEINGKPTQGWTVVDCGIDNAATREGWESVIAHHMQGLPVLRVVVTHMHPDHIGLAHWLCERFDAPLWISATDYQSARVGLYDPQGFGSAASGDFYASHGLRDPEFHQHLQTRRSYYPTLVPRLPASYVRMMDGDTLTIDGAEWHCIAGYGHAPEHIALYCPGKKLLISGDMVLPRISTNVSVFSMEPESNPLRLFLDSLERYLPLAEDTLTLPSHGKPFVGLHTRIEQLKAHHDDRLNALRVRCKEDIDGVSATDALPILFSRTLDAHQLTFAVGEAVAHLHLLWRQGEVARRLGADGIYRFMST